MASIGVFLLPPRLFTFTTLSLLQWGVVHALLVRPLDVLLSLFLHAPHRQAA